MERQLWLPAPFLALVLLAVPATGHGASLEGYDPASPLEGGAWLLDNGLYLKAYNYPEDGTFQDFFELINRTHTQVRKGPWNVGVQVDAVLNAPPADPVEGPVNPLFGTPAPRHAVEDAYLVPEKVFLQYRSRRFKVEIGDSYLSIGKGIALSLARRPEIDQDNSLRGVKLSLTTSPVNWTAFAGLINAQNISVVSINRALQLPAGEFVFGTAGLIRPSTSLEIGLHGIGVTFDRPNEDGSRMAVDRLTLIRQPVQLGTFGGTLRFPRLGPVDWFTEGDVFVYGKTPEGETPVYQLEGEENELHTGYAIYSGAQVFGTNVAFLAEIKRYKHHLRQRRGAGVTENAMVTPPTLELEEVIQPDSQHAVTSNAMTGYRLRWTMYVPKTSHNLYVNFANFVDDADVPGHDREVIFHPHMGAQFFWGPGHHLFLTAGYRGEFNIEDDTPLDREFGDDHMWHLFVDGAVVIKASTLELASNVRIFEETGDDGNDWFSAESSLSWHYKGFLSVALLFDATSEGSSLSGPLAVPGNLLMSDDPAKPLGLFGGIEAGVHPTPATSVKVFAGAQKQGLRCTGGVCRWLPGFSGVRAEFTMSL